MSENSMYIDELCNQYATISLSLSCFSSLYKYLCLCTATNKFLSLSLILILTVGCNKNFEDLRRRIFHMKRVSRRARGCCCYTNCEKLRKLNSSN